MTRDAFFRLAQHRIATDLGATMSKQVTIDTERRRLMAARDAKDRLDRQATAIAQNAYQRHSSSAHSLDLVITLDAYGQISDVFQAALPITGVPHRVT